MSIRDRLIPETLKPTQLVPLYLMASFAYYHLHDTFYTDGEFDILAKRLLIRWGEIEHQHKSLIDLRSLKTKSSAYYIKFHQYPLITQHATHQLLDLIRNEK